MAVTVFQQTASIYEFALRAAGCKVRFGHNAFGSHGGVTTALVTLPSGAQVIGVARCSDDDRYNESTGEAIAARRAFELVAPTVGPIGFEQYVDVRFQ